MKTLEQLRKEFPELRKYSDAELRAIRTDLYKAARLIVSWWIEHKTRSKSLPSGRLPAPGKTRYDRED